MIAPGPGRLLVARPMLGDPNFIRSVVFLLEHNASGTLGLIINRPLNLPLGELWDDCPQALGATRLCAEGGPVDRDKGLLLHADRGLPGCFAISTSLAVGGDPAALAERFAAGAGSTGPRLFLGHSGWGEGQLIGEIEQGAWLVRHGNPALVLDAEPPEDLWQHLVSAGEEPELPSLN